MTRSAARFEKRVDSGRQVRFVLGRVRLSFVNQPVRGNSSAYVSTISDRPEPIADLVTGRSWRRVLELIFLYESVWRCVQECLEGGQPGCFFSMTRSQNEWGQ